MQNRSDEDFNRLAAVTDDFLGKLNERPEISKAHSTFNTDYPQISVSVDAAKCLMHGLQPLEVLKTLSSYVGGDYASDFNRFTKTYRVMVQASASQRLNAESLAHMFVRNRAGELLPVGDYVELKPTNGAEYLTHFDLFPAIRVNGTPAPGYSSGQALQAVSEVAAQTLPVGFGYELSGMSREESTQGNATAWVLVLSVVFIYIVLSSLYESLFVPLSVLLVIPFGLLGSFLLTGVLGVENNIYMQTGIVMLVGMLSKTAILLTEVACERRRHGSTIAAAALCAAKVRFRPIVMTATVMVFGMLPLLFSSGAGAKGDLSIGATVLGGMVVGILALLFFVPVLFCAFQHLDEVCRGRSRA